MCTGTGTPVHYEQAVRPRHELRARRQGDARYFPGVLGTSLVFMVVGASLVFHAARESGPHTSFLLYFIILLFWVRFSCNLRS